MLMITGAVLLWAARMPVGTQAYQQLSWSRSFLIGCWQALAILPGLSRSGSTISAGLSVGLTRHDAAAFSFLMAVPVMAGAALLEGVDMWREGLHTDPVHLALGALLSFGVGLVSLTWLIRWLERGKLAYFAYWCIPVGAAIMARQLS